MGFASRSTPSPGSGTISFVPETGADVIGSLRVSGFVTVSVCEPAFSVCVCVSASFSISVCVSVDLSTPVVISVSVFVSVSVSVCVSVSACVCISVRTR